MNDSEELAEKYHKLFQDYTRIKAQHAVLKKAVVKEQTENAAMQAAMKEKEQEVRKSLQDLDLLSFHNQRLTKRIENLQTLAATKSGGSWLMGGGSVKKELEKSQSTLEAATIDLQAKIEENEKLHQQLYEINALYPRHVTELQGKIQELEKQNQELQEDVQRAGVANEDTITMIRKEKEAVERELGLIRDALAGELKDEQRAHQNLREKAHHLEDEIERLRKVEVEMESLQAEHAKLQGELETFKWISSELSQLQESYNALERDKTQMERAHAQLSQQYSALRQAEDGLRRTLAQEQENLRATKEQNRSLTRDMETVREEVSQREQGHVSRIEQLESELEMARKEQEQLKIQYQELKVAEQSAKEGESLTRAELARDLSGMELSLKNAKARVKELEKLKETLEAELAETKKALEETKASLVLEQEKRAPAHAPETSKNEKNEELEQKDARTTATEEGGHGTEDDNTEKEKAPLSKKAKKKKAAAAAAAAAAAVAPSLAATKNTTKDEREEIKDKVNNKDSTLEKVAESNTDEEEQERKAKEAELQIQKDAVDALNTEIKTLRAQVEASKESTVAKEDELTAVQVALETVKDEKATLASSLEMHVELTIQLQQEVDELKSTLAKKQKGGVNGASVKESQVVNDDDSQLQRTRNKSAQGTVKGDHTPQREIISVPAASPLLEGNKSPSAASVKDESTQVDKVDAVDKAIQSEKVEQVDESTQADLVKESSAGIAEASVADDKDIQGSKESKGGKTGKTGKDGKDSTVSRRSMEYAPSRGSAIMGEVDEDMMQLTCATQATSSMNNANQSNREYLIKKHYESKIQNITEQLQLSDGRYVRLHREFELLRELLLDTVKEKEQLKVKNEHLQEELASAKEDNRAQIESMTNFMKSLESQGR